MAAPFPHWGKILFSFTATYVPLRHILTNSSAKEKEKKKERKKDRDNKREKKENDKLWKGNVDRKRKIELKRMEEKEKEIKKEEREW